MDDRMKELIAVGASAAVNCHPCMKYHLAECDRLGVAREEVAAAAEVGMTVNRGAATQTRRFVAELLGAETGAPQKEGGCCSG
jgi:AhpD family alkylhydroperoxidase